MRPDIGELIEKLEKAAGKDRDLDEDIAMALGGSIRRVSTLGLNGRGRGSYRVFWEGADAFGRGSAIPYYTKDATTRARAVARLRSLQGEKT